MGDLDQPTRSELFKATSVAESYQAHLAPAVFAPWAAILVELAGVGSGHRVLDVASGTGVVARLAARHAGPDGLVVASDISGPMLAEAATQARWPGAATIEQLEAPVTDLKVADGEFDIVLCQQGMQFFPDRLAAAVEMRRALRAGGVLGLAVWAEGHRLEPFDDYAEALIAAGIDPPFPRAFESSSFVMSPGELEAVLSGAGFTDVRASVVEQTVTWPDSQTAAAGVFGTVFGPTVAGLPAERREPLLLDIAARLGGGSDEPVRRSTHAVLARASA
jgi:ubiquinone/menaquinone biosynthesis C-methylase UbiE